MILTFSNEEFVQKIIDGDKIHTIREDKTSRWYPGRIIQFWFGNPRNVKNNPYEFMKGECISDQKIEINYQGLQQHGMIIPTIKVDGKFLPYWKKEELAINDGFTTLHGFLQWFDKDFTGKIIHFTDYRY